MSRATIDLSSGSLVFAPAVHYEVGWPEPSAVNGEPAPEWMMKGIPAKDKGKDQLQQVVP